MIDVLEEAQEREALLKKELMQLREENALLIGIITDYRESFIRPKEAARIDLSEGTRQNKKVKVPLPVGKLTSNEYKVLRLLIHAKNHVLSRNELAMEMWGSENRASDMSRLSLITRKLRVKLKIDQGEQEILKTQWGSGYRLTSNFFNYYEIDDRLRAGVDERI